MKTYENAPKSGFDHLEDVGNYLNWERADRLPHDGGCVDRRCPRPRREGQ